MGLYLGGFGYTAGGGSGGGGTAQSSTIVTATTAFTATNGASVEIGETYLLLGNGDTWGGLSSGQMATVNFAPLSDEAGREFILKQAGIGYGISNYKYHLSDDPSTVGTLVGGNIVIEEGTPLNLYIVSPITQETPNDGDVEHNGTVVAAHFTASLVNGELEYNLVNAVRHHPGPGDYETRSYDSVVAASTGAQTSDELNFDLIVSGLGFGLAQSQDTYIVVDNYSGNMNVIGSWDTVQDFIAERSYLSDDPDEIKHLKTIEIVDGATQTYYLVGMQFLNGAYGTSTIGLEFALTRTGDALSAVVTNAQYATSGNETNLTFNSLPIDGATNGEFTTAELGRLFAPASLSNLSQRVTVLENSPTGAGYPAADAAKVANVPADTNASLATLTAAVALNTAKVDNDTIYDDTALDARVTALEGATPTGASEFELINSTSDLTSPYEGGTYALDTYLAPFTFTINGAVKNIYDLHNLGAGNGNNWPTNNVTIASSVSGQTILMPDGTEATMPIVLDSTDTLVTIMSDGNGNLVLADTPYDYPEYVAPVDPSSVQQPTALFTADDIGEASSFGGGTFTNVSAPTLEGEGGILIDRTPGANANLIKNNVFTGDVADVGVIAFGYTPTATDMNYQTVNSISTRIYPPGGSATYIDGVTQDKGMDTALLRTKGTLWHSMHISEFPAFDGLTTSQINTRMFFASNSPHTSNVVIDALLMDAKDKSLIKLWVDDLHFSVYQNMRPILNNYPLIKMNVVVPYDFLDQAGRLTTAEVLQLQADGHCIVMNVTANDRIVYLTHLTVAEVVSSVQTAQAGMVAAGIDPKGLRHGVWSNGNYQFNDEYAVKQGVSVTAGSNIASLPDVTGVKVGDKIAHLNIDKDVTVTAINAGANEITMSKNALNTNTTFMRFGRGAVTLEDVALTLGSNVIPSGGDDISNVAVGQLVASPVFPVGTRVTAVGATDVTVDNNATETSSNRDVRFINDGGEFHEDKLQIALVEETELRFAYTTAAGGEESPVFDRFGGDARKMFWPRQSTTGVLVSSGYMQGKIAKTILQGRTLDMYFHIVSSSPTSGLNMSLTDFEAYCIELTAGVNAGDYEVVDCIEWADLRYENYTHRFTGENGSLAIPNLSIQTDGVVGQGVNFPNGAGAITTSPTGLQIACSQSHANPSPSIANRSEWSAINTFVDDREAIIKYKITKSSTFDNSKVFTVTQIHHLDHTTYPWPQFLIQIDNGNLVARRQQDLNTAGANPPIDQLQAITDGVEYEVELRIRFREDTTGKIQVYVDGVERYNFDGQTAYVGKPLSDVYVKGGLYPQGSGSYTDSEIVMRDLEFGHVPTILLA